VKHLHRPTVNQKSSPVPTRDESETRRNNEREDLTIKRRRESNQDKTKHSPFSWNSSPLEMNPSPRRNNDGSLDDKERRRTVETLPMEEAHHLNPA